ncbi:TetR/AcrR family transcriptional regulator C-terminal domain-containing protein [Nonomuraea sp. NPDC003560]|uniref:TetR/AcrR family transcriptional regulator C-terminal domain-containing protein n=1 Tax=Nonomuraea sp. NPDC003560 TaxID=3364341 RepID=UPI003680D5E1
MADRGLLDIHDADSAAAHRTLLTVTDVNQRTFYGAVPLPQEEITQLVTIGVRAFLRSYAPTVPWREASRRRTVRPGAAAGGQVSRARSRPWPVCSAACSSGR